MTDGNLRVVASADLGGLGAKDGPSVSYQWVPPSLMPLALPWLAILGLLACRRNRCASAWWILLPLGGLALLDMVQLTTFQFLPSGALDVILEVVIALAFGLASVWLLAPRSRHHWFLTWLYALLILAGFAVCTFAVRQDWIGGWGSSLQTGILLLLNVFTVSLAVGLAGLCCRRHYRPIALYVWISACLVAAWLIVVVPFFVIAIVASSGRIPWLQFFIIPLILACIGFGTLLPFLILASASPFYRERLKGLLHVRPPAPPFLRATPTDQGRTPVNIVP